MAANLMFCKGVLNALQQQQADIFTIRAETPKLIDSRIESAFEDKQVFPNPYLHNGEQK